MLLRLRLPSVVVARVASVGVALGLVFAADELATQRYLAHDLWRTALYVVSHDTLLGALGGAAAALLMWLSLAACAARARAKGSPTNFGPAAAAPRFIIGLTAFFAIAVAAAILLVPVHTPRLLGLPHWIPFGAGVAVIWLVVAGTTADPSFASARDGLRSRVAIWWPTLVALAYLVGLAHLWARGWPGWVAAAVACAGILASLALSSVFSRPAAWVADRLSTLLPSCPPAVARWAPRLAAAVMVVVWGASSVVGMATRRSAASSGANVLLIAVDTLRYDAVSLLAKDENRYDLTPELRRLLAPHATVFTRAYSPSAWTLASFASMFTGLYPEQHGAEFLWSTLAPEQTTLAELLRERGYATAAVVSGHFVTREVGLAQGFSRCDEAPALGSQLSTSAQVTDRALRFLQGRGKRPFFLFVHYFEPHFPYVEHPDTTPTAQLRAAQRAAAREGEPAWGRLAYDGEVAYADRHIGRLLRFVDQHHLWKSTCVIFVADHGEEFWEHGSRLHGRTLFQEIIHTPLAIAAPGGDLPRVVIEPVETRRLFSTILQMTGAPSPPGVAAGPSLLSPGARQAAPIYSATCAYGRGDRTGPEAHSWLSSLTGDRYKLIHDRNQEEMRLFDLQADPGETHDLSRKRREVAAPLARALVAMETSLSGKEPPRATRRLTEKERRRLKDLGYL